MFPLQPTYLDRANATKYLRDTHGIKLGDSGLENMAHKNSGPEYIIKNGRALYTREALDNWALNKTARPTLQAADQPASAA